MDITIKINCDNAAFGNDAGKEVARILRHQATSLSYSNLNEEFDNYIEKLHDINGNIVGSVEITP